MKRFLFLSLALILFSCNNDDGGDSGGCTEVFVYGLSIDVIDSTTGNAVGSGITVTATDGNYSEELMFSLGSWIGAGERPGTYDISITSQQYTPATFNNIVVTMTSDGCHVQTESREIFISPF
ncbi:hypothetical protein POV27_14560 [Aureisphaera galaxeae]|uniref:hypothetical protein n=1 Tax=Aureisphaera galaxeae TaxID=1538023 RepID=UPI0023501EDD|nr:hypothetical protein [Aureisphaera galaxeae]MDC8005281.1 hypothetical protein [Aureisphaera galaxeae]